MKKLFGVLVFLFFVVSFASAAYYGNDLGSGLAYGMEQLIDAVEGMLGPFFSVILGGSDDMLFERILFLAIILAIVYVVISGMDVFRENPFVIWIVSISIALLSTRFLVEQNLVQTMLLPYSVFGITVTSALPLLIFFLFVHKNNNFTPTIRKILWIFFIVVFVGIWGARYNEVGDLAWIYFMTGVAALLFLLFDGTIRRAMVSNRMKQMTDSGRQWNLAQVQETMSKLEEFRRNTYIDEAEYKRRRKDLQKQMKMLMKN